MAEPKMADMKMSKAEKKSSDCCMPVTGNGPDYPWGLELSLDEPALKKLGIKALPDAGAECNIVAVGKVVNVSQSATAGKEGQRNLRIQITKLNVELESDEAAQVLRGYKGKAKK